MQHGPHVDVDVLENSPPRHTRYPCGCSAMARSGQRADGRVEPVRRPCCPLCGLHCLTLIPWG